MFVKATCSLTDKNAVLLTFDDGPHPIFTPRLLELLRKNDIKAMFFCIGHKVESFPEITKMIENEGHTIGNHTFTHTPKYTFWGKRRILDEIRKCHERLSNVGIVAHFFRPPLGITNGDIAWACKQLNYKVIGWSLRSFDTQHAARDVVFRRVARKLRGGDIILLHDRLEGVEWLVNEIITEVRRRGMRFASPDELKIEISK